MSTNQPNAAERAEPKPCPTCKRRPSERYGRYEWEVGNDVPYVSLETCPDPIHDLADRLVADALTGSAPRVCSVCTGTGKPLSGKPCICGGSGRENDEIAGLRLEILRMEQAAPGAVETPLVAELRAKIQELHGKVGNLHQQMKHPDYNNKGYRRQLKAEIHAARAQTRRAEERQDKAEEELATVKAELAALKASARSAPVDPTRVVDAAESWCRADDYRHDAATKELYAAVDAWRAAGGKRSRPLYDDEAPAPPSAERILTQATDVDFKEIADLIARHYEQRACIRDGAVDRNILAKGLRKHFPAVPSSGGAAVVMPDAQLGWVIERYIGNTLHYWSGHPKEERAWTPKNEDALRLAREADAWLIQSWHLNGEGRVTQHVWLNSGAASEKGGADHE